MKSHNGFVDVSCELGTVKIGSWLSGVLYSQTRANLRDVADAFMIALYPLSLLGKCLGDRRADLSTNTGNDGRFLF